MCKMCTVLEKIMSRPQRESMGFNTSAGSSIDSRSNPNDVIGFY